MAGVARASKSEVTAAMQQLSMGITNSHMKPQLQKAAVLDKFGFDDEKLELQERIVADVLRSMEHADGAAGDAEKYKYAVLQMAQRWRIFVAIFDFDEQEPTLEMVKQFTIFMYKNRQRGSKVGRHGLGDSVAKMAQYTLAQVRSYPTQCTRV